MQRIVPSLLALALPVAALGAEPAKSRTFEFAYTAKVTGLTAGKTANIWIPLPQSNEDQDVKLIGESFPGIGKVDSELQYGNRFLYIEAQPNAEGVVPIALTFLVKRKEVRGLTDTKANNPNQIERFLKPDELVPITGKPLDLIKDKKLPDDPTGKAKEFYEVVNNHMKYGKPEGKPWGRGDSVWACDSKVGNCTDFHSIFISLARANKIPAKFEIGVSIPTARGKGEVTGYHCWAKFRPSDKGWMAVDISEANKDPKMKDYYFGNLTEDRVTLSTGRDITLAPPQKGKPVNFIVFPYVEVDGAPYDAAKITRKMWYEDK